MKEKEMNFVELFVPIFLFPSRVYKSRNSLCCYSSDQDRWMVETSWFLPFLIWIQALYFLNLEFLEGKNNKGKRFKKKKMLDNSHAI